MLLFTCKRFSSRAVISYFDGEDEEGLGESIYPGSDDDLGMDESDREDDAEIGRGK